MSLQLLAKQMEAKGRGGDSVLVHMTPDEVAGLQKLAESAGGSLSVNPETGLVEANFLKRLLPTLAGIGVGMFAGPMAGAAAGALVGGMTAPKEQRNTGILLGALGGYGGAGIGAGLGAAGSTAAQATAMSAEAAKQAGIAGAQQTAQQAAMAEGAKLAGAEAAQTSAQQLATEKLAQEAAAEKLRQEAGAQAINQAAEKAGTEFAAKGVATQAGEGIQALAGQPGRDAFLGQVGMKTAGMAAAPLMAPGERPPEEAPDDEMYVYDFDYGRTGADRMAGGTSSERTYFNPEFSNRRKVRAADYFSAAEGGEVADAAPVDAGIAGGMSGASKAAYDYLMGNATSSAPQGIAAPAMMASMAEPAQVEARADRMYSFNPATGAFTKNPNYRDPAALSGIPGLIGRVMSGGGGDYNPSSDPDFGRINPDGSYNYNFVGPFGGPTGPYGEGNYDSFPSEVGSYDYSGVSEPFGATHSDYGDVGYDRAAGGEISLASGGLMGLAKGGMKSGGFVIPADVVSMVGEGNTDAGYKRIKSMVPGATAIKGKDGGQADTVKTSIEGKQPARVAHGEMYVPPETVKRMGGAKKLYAMMDRVRQQATGSKKQIKPVNLRRAMA
jgi:hypothetical protein